jgi:uncharacterized membrane protein
MSDRARFVLATLTGLVLAAIVHVVAVLLMPWLSERDAYSRLRATLTADRSELVAAPGAADSWLPHPDPAVAVAACAYQLDEGPVRISAKTGALFQSLSFHARGGGAYFAVTDRAAVRGALEIVVMTRHQLDETLALEDLDEPSRDVRIVAPNPQGVVVVRALAAFPSLREEAVEAAKSVSCTIDPAPGTE